MTTIKITELTNIGANLATSTVIPVVNMAGTPTTEKTVLGNIANVVLAGAGGNYVAAAKATTANTVTINAQPNITSTGNLIGLTVSNANGVVNFTTTANVTLGAVGNLHITGGTTDQLLTTDGTGNLSWTTVSGGNGTPSGSNTQIQFNDAGAFGGNTGFTFDKTTGILAAPFADVSGVANIVGGGATVATKSVLNVASTFGSNDANDPASAQAVRGRVTGANLTKTRNYVTGVTGQYLVTGTNASEFIKAGILGVVGDQTTTADGAVVAYLDGDGGLTTANAAYAVSMKNSTPNSGFNYGLDLQFISLNLGGVTTSTFKQADIRFNNGVTLVANTANNISINANVTVGNVIADNLGNISSINIDGSNSNVLYGNGVFAAVAGGNANTGNVTFSDINIIGTGNLKLQPDSANASAYLDIFLTAGPDIHIAGNGETVILGTDDYANVAVNVNGNVSIQANAGTPQTWNFGTDGYVTFPLGSTINNAPDIVTVTLDQFTDGGYPGTQVFTKTSDTLYELSPGGPYMTLISGVWRLKISTATYYDSTDLITWSTVAGGLPAPIGSPTAVATMNLEVGGNVWTFDAEGGLTLPIGVSIDYNGNVQYPTIMADSGKLFSVQGQGNTGSAALAWTVDPNAASQYAAVAVSRAGDNLAKVVLQAQSDSGNVGTVKLWNFDETGNLTLPGNTFAVNYANGTQVSISGGGNTGNVTFSDQVVMGTGGNDGDGGLYLAPGNASIANSAVQYLRVRGGDVVTHIHLDTGNNAFYDQYFGADSRYVKLEANGNVVINADDYNGNGATWTLDTTGNLNLPGNLVIAGNANVFGTNSSLLQTTDNRPLIALSSGANGAVSSVWVEDIGNVGTSNIAAVYANPTSGSGIVRIVVGQNGVGSGPNLWDFNANGTLTFPGTPRIDTSTNNFEVQAAEAINFEANAVVNIYTDAGNNAFQWQFGDDGNLTLPGDIVGSANANFTIYSNAAAHEFIFADDGTFYAPDNVVLGGNSIYIGPGANTLTGIEHEVFIASSNHFAYVQGVINNVSDNGSADWVALGAKGDDTGGQATMGFTSSGFGDANYTITGGGDGYLFTQSYAPGSLAPFAGGGNLVLATGNQGTTKDIIFGTGGFLTGNIFGRISHANNSLELSRSGATITFPDATEQTTAYISPSVTGNWTLAAGNNTVNISVPLNGTYSIWVNGNIPNGIITYTATAVITNTNVPVLGEQYAWYYALGNALVLTSIPNQFVGTVGSISNVNTYAGNTANVFTFGITNNSGNTAVVNYGYTKL